MAERHQVLVVGGGFGGLSVTKALAHADVDVTIVDRTNHHLFQPLLYQVATGILSEGVIAPPLRGVIKNQTNARTVFASVTRFDLDTRTVHGVSPDGGPLQRRYDTLVVAGGWSNRIITLYSWLPALSFTHHRGERIITVEQAHNEATRAAARRDPDELNRLLSKRA